MEIKILKEEDYTTATWAGGKTTQLYICPEASQYQNLDFKFRISSATVELEESVFTKLTGVRRFISPLDGSLLLTHNHEEAIELNPYEVYEFSGGIETRSYGKVRDFNLMLANGASGVLKSAVDMDRKLLINYDQEQEFCIFLYLDAGTIEIKVNHKEVRLAQRQTLIAYFGKKEKVHAEIVGGKGARILYGIVLF